MRLSPSRRWLQIIAAVVFATALPASAAERIIGLPCEDCEGALVGKPAEIAATARIARLDDVGEPLVLRGRTLDLAGKPVAGIVVYAYHTDADGHYPRADALRGTPAQHHGRLRGWARSDAAGEYRFDTIRPAGYPQRRDPAHIHLHVIEPGRCSYYIDDVNFRDDPRLTAATERRTPPQRGGSGIVAATRDDGGRWQATRDIVLGKNIGDYEDCGG